MLTLDEGPLSPPWICDPELGSVWQSCQLTPVPFLLVWIWDVLLLQSIAFPLSIEVFQPSLEK